MNAAADPTGKPEASGTEEVLIQASAKPPWRKILLLGLVIAAVLALVYLSPLREHLGKARELSESIRELGWIAPVVLCVSVAILWRSVFHASPFV